MCLHCIYIIHNTYAIHKQYLCLFFYIVLTLYLQYNYIIPTLYLHYTYIIPTIHLHYTYNTLTLCIHYSYIILLQASDNHSIAVSAHYNYWKLWTHQWKRWQLPFSVIKMLAKYCSLLPPQKQANYRRFAKPTHNSISQNKG